MTPAIKPQRDDRAARERIDTSPRENLLGEASAAGPTARVKRALPTPAIKPRLDDRAARESVVAVLASCKQPDRLSALVETRHFT
jgi:hypothetical protein